MFVRVLLCSESDNITIKIKAKFEPLSPQDQGAVFKLHLHGVIYQLTSSPGRLTLQESTCLSTDVKPSGAL